MTATTATAARFVAVRAEGRYRVQDTTTGEYVVIAASKAKAAYAADRLNEQEAAAAAEVAAEETAQAEVPANGYDADAVTAAIATAVTGPADARQETATELAQAVADGAVSFDAAATALLSGNGAALVAELSAPTNDEAEWLAHVNADAPADEEPEAAQSTEEPREEAPVAEETPAAPEAPEQPEDAPAVASVRVPGRIVAFALARPDSYGAELRAALDARKATKDGSRTVKLAHALRAELLSVAQDVEMDARAAVKDGDIPAVSLVLAATALQTRVAGTL